MGTSNIGLGLAFLCGFHGYDLGNATVASGGMMVGGGRDFFGGSVVLGSLGHTWRVDCMRWKVCIWFASAFCYLAILFRVEEYIPSLFFAVWLRYYWFFVDRLRDSALLGL